MLRDGGLWGSGKAKLIRFIVLQTIRATLIPVTGGYSLVTSLGLGAVDSFFLDKMRLGYNPRYFIKEFRYYFFT